MRIIAGEARGRVIEAPRGLNTRPTLDRVRENLFNILQNQVYGKRVLDLFAGSGALSLEALSRGACFAVLADIDRNAFEVQKRNIALLRYEERTRQFRCDWLNAVRQLQKENERFDIVFLDPPYAMKDLQSVTESLIPLLAEDAMIILEHEAGAEPLVTEAFDC
ncbi:MAG: 16S rRNA (guanine(966)-N(2))-methyltransferase RsmD, partial [Clostridia bacterium]|nr:16S rRNA (guanine(966)-N(2))-methyltransferase RsmD [Clostridia bacterium]